MRIAISLVMAGCLLAAGCKKGDSSESVASNAPSCAAVDDLLLKIDGVNENVGMQEAFQAGLQSLPDKVREDAVNRINAKVASDGARMRAAEGGPRQWVALLLLSAKSEARAVEDYRYCSGDFDFGNGQRWHWTYSMSNGPAGPELRIQSAQMASGGVATGSTSAGNAQNASVIVTGVDTGNAVGADQRISAPMTSFAPMDAIYVAVSTTTSDPAASLSGKLGVKWTHLDSNQLVHEESRDIVFAGSGVTDFQISKPDGWPIGNYQVEISLNGTLVQMRQFQVQAGDGATTVSDAAMAAGTAAADAADAAAAAAAAAATADAPPASPAIKEAQAKWVKAIYNAIAPNWIRPSSEESRDYPCKATVGLLHDGTVSFVEFRSPCSNLGMVERSIEAAIYKSSPLPIPSDPAAFDRTLSIAFSPGPQ